MTTNHLQDAHIEAALRMVIESDDFDAALFNEIVSDIWETTQIAGVSTFEDSGLLTRDKGLVLRFKDGAEFQITIRQSKSAKQI